MAASPVSYVAAMVSPQPELLDAFVSSIGGSKTSLGGIADVYLEPVPVDALTDDAAQGKLRDADFCLMLVRFLDDVTVNAIREIVRNLPSKAVQSLHVLICRKAGETDYKISCTKCGQKLMVRDSMAFRRAKCPQCQDFFQVPGQSDIIRTALLLPSNRVVRKLDPDDAASCARALEAVIGHHVEHAETALSQTMRIDLAAE